MDYYDANTKVIKDQYSLYDILGTEVFHAKEGTVKPGTIGDDFKVYLSKKVVRMLRLIVMETNGIFLMEPKSKFIKFDLWRKQ